MRKFINLASVVLVSFCATVDARGTEMTGYQSDAVNLAPISSNDDKGYALERCVRNWDEIRIERTRVDTSKQGRAVLLEIGNSGFPRYDYVLMEGGVMTNGNGATINVSETPLEGLLDKAFLADAAALRSGKDSGGDDGDCYFLTLKEDGRKEVIEVYGDSGSKLIKMLINRILYESSRPRVDGD